MNPNHTNAIFNRSVTYKAMGKYREAYNDALLAKSKGFKVTDSYLKELEAKLK